VKKMLYYLTPLVFLGAVMAWWILWPYPVPPENTPNGIAANTTTTANTATMTTDSTTTANNNQSTMSTPNPAMKVAYTAYFTAIMNNDYNAWVGILDPSGTMPPQSGFEMLVKGSRSGGILTENINAQFVKAVDVSQRYGIPNLIVYVTSFPFSEPVDNPVKSNDPSVGRGNCMFMISNNGVYKIKALVPFNYGKNEFDADLEQTLQNISF
jgi:hypothetical protein